MGVRRRLNNALKALAGLPPPPPRIPPPEVTASYEPDLLRHSTVLVTGAGRNIGRAVALEMARHGAGVVAVDNHPGRLARIENELAEMARLSGAHLVDVSDPHAIDALAATLQADSVPIDVLVNNVGVSDNLHRLEDLDVLRWQSQFQTNVFGPLYLTRRVVQPMIDANRTGSVLFITSIHQEVLYRNPTYSTTKAALGMVVRELATELSAAGIRVNALAPGWTNETGGESEPGNQSFVLLGGNPIPARYMGRAAVYLSSDFFSHYTTGTVLTIDAGLGLHSYRSVQVPPSK